LRGVFVVNKFTFSKGGDWLRAGMKFSIQA
jgi:hypothetical protein